MGSGPGDPGGDGVVPEDILGSIGENLTLVEEIRVNLDRLLALTEADVLAELPPLERARSFLVLATTATALFSVRLRCNGICPDDHPIKTELDRLSLHEEKLRKYNDWSKAPLRPSVKINTQAATRFIQHSLPDLEPEQRKNLHEISRGSDCRTLRTQRATKKQKHHSSELPSVRVAVQEFLEKASRELLGSNESGVKGPLRNITSDDNDDK
ncbi:hypothetical protein HPP92_016578 [Vanilla planifolia]|uniref:Nuclear nucleic acid-binding protein C1D n=1 Tax=Vanilla planifolia TaxID=51239 RepID=A0A835QQJ6_VANPL|nr:hypothetical protein HPP92_016578 [Vanilla planifolia]